MIVLRRFS